MTDTPRRFKPPYRMPVYRRPLKLWWALFFDNHMGAFCLRHDLTPAPPKRQSTGRWSLVTTHEHGAAWIGVDGIEAAIKQTDWLDRRQKGRAIRKARRIERMLVPA